MSTRETRLDPGPPALARVLWIAIYVVLILSPLTLMLGGSDQLRRSWVVEFSVALGFVALIMLALQMVLPTRAAGFSRSFGVDVLLQLHRPLGWVALALVVGHVGILLVDDPGLLYLLDPSQAPWRARFGVAALLGLVALIASSVWRARVRLRYERWRGLHVLLGLAIVVFSALHVVGVGRYVAIGSLRWIAIYAAVAAGIAVLYLRVLRPMEFSGEPYRVAKVTPELGGATTIELDGGPVPPRRFGPGQFAWIKYAGAPYALVEHPFSYSSSAERPERPTFTIKSRGDFTDAVADLETGVDVVVDGPHGSYRLPEAGPLLLIAGGVGITPMMSVLETLADRRDPRSLRLIYASREWADVTFRDRLAELTEGLDLEVIHVLSRPQAGWDGPTGRLDRLSLARLLPEWVGEAHVFVCAPPSLTESVVTDLAVLGIDGARVHAETFLSV